MAKQITTQCPKCHESFEGKLTKNLAGFSKVKCPKCGEKKLFPLGKVYKTIYWIIIIWTVGSVLYNLVTQNFEDIFNFSIAGIALLVVSIYGLLKNQKIIKAQK